MDIPRHFLDIDVVDASDLRAILDDSLRRKAARRGRGQVELDEDPPCVGRLLAMIFEKASTRTRVSFDVAIRQLGGESLLLRGEDTQLGRGETIGDTARVLSRYVDAIMIRTSAHENLLEMAAHATVPVINGLTDRTHPCQVLADIMTFEEHRGPLARRVVAWWRGRQQYGDHMDARFGKLRLRTEIGVPPGVGAIAVPNSSRRRGKAGAYWSRRIPKRPSRARTASLPIPGYRWVTMSWSVDTICSHPIAWTSGS